MTESECKPRAPKRKITDFFTVTKKAKVAADEVGKAAPVEKVGRDGEEKEQEKEGEAGADSPGEGAGGFKRRFAKTLTAEERGLLALELETLEDGWFEALHREFTKPYFLELKRFLRREWGGTTPIFPPQKDIYSWSRLTPLDRIKVFIIGQDPYHNFNQAHGLAFSVLDPNTRVPPSLVNIFKEVGNDYPGFTAPRTGNLTRWAREGVLMLNTVLTVQAHRANSHANRGWEQFTKVVLATAIERGHGIVVIAWGKPAQRLIAKYEASPDCVSHNLFLKGVHPSPLSAYRDVGFFNQGYFRRCNRWLQDHQKEPIHWNVV